MDFVDDGANRYNFVCNVPIGSIDVCGEEKRSLTYVSDQPGFNYAEFIADLTHINEDTSTPTDFRPNELLGEGDCIERLTVMMHGGATRNNERAIVQWGDTALEENAHKEEISNMFSNVCFCNECTIELRSCNIGNSLYLKNRLEEKTGCKIILYNRAVGSFGIHNEK